MTEDGIENRKRILAVIPARGGSKGVAKKNIRLLGGKPLISYVSASVKKSRWIDRMIISTDDEDIMRSGESIGVDVPFRRPADLASDNTPLIAVVLHAYHFFRERKHAYDAVLSVQPTCPFIQYETIDRAVELWMKTGCDSVTTIAEMTKGHPYISKRLLPNNAIESFSPIPEGVEVGSRQKREVAYYLTGGLYLRDKRLLDRAEPKGHCLGNDARAVVVNEYEAVDINNEFDMKFAEFLLQSGIV